MARNIWQTGDIVPGPNGDGSWEVEWCSCETRCDTIIANMRLVSVKRETAPSHKESKEAVVAYADYLRAQLELKRIDEMLNR